MSALGDWIVKQSPKAQAGFPFSTAEANSLHFESIRVLLIPTYNIHTHTHTPHTHARTCMHLAVYMHCTMQTASSERAPTQ